MASRGALPAQLIRQLVRVNQLIDVRGPYAEERIQPASADLSLSAWGYCVKAAFLPNPDETVEVAIQRYSLFPVDLSTPQVLNQGSTYIFRLNERLELSEDLFAYFSPKSSIGRVNVWVRTVADHVSRYDRVPAGYKGPLYVMVTPKSWPVVVEAGLSLNQVRFFTETEAKLSRVELRLLDEEFGLTVDPRGERLTNPTLLDDGILLTVDLTSDIVAYRAKHSIELLDLTKEARHDPLDFFDPIGPIKHDELVLRENDFYLLPTYEAFRVPTDYCVEMVAYDVASGEFRSHYAGFFDPGFGFGTGTLQGTPATLEVIPHETVILRHRQPVCKMVFERLVITPDKIYGTKEIGSHYQHQRGPGLSKFFVKPSKQVSTPPVAAEELGLAKLNPTDPPDQPVVSPPDELTSITIALPKADLPKAVTNSKETRW
ncbi:2'-deoxycytidine 5'-triphosphate deaminase [Candidatus Berkelbacteria bacterium]|nr:2'-deoxycytidine 5'-triphosphate deaminase [Candidatus Berkelbacteria bacterium]